MYTGRGAMYTERGAMYTGRGATYTGAGEQYTGAVDTYDGVTTQPVSPSVAADNATIDKIFFIVFPK